MLTLAPESLDWALKHVERHGDTDVFPTPFEYAAIRHDWPNIRAFLSSQNVLEWKVRARRQLLAPKARYGFRVITQLDPLDLLLFTAHVYEIGADIEAKHIPTVSDVVFSYRFQPTAEGDFFDQRIGYKGFTQASRDKGTGTDPGVYVAVTDISDFYSRIYHHRLENRLCNATQRTTHVKTIMRLLSNWNGTETFGIPIGNAASRLLAEINLSDVDEALLANNVTFVRFNDDYRIFAQTHAEAYRHLAFLAETLYRNHGLTLQRQKTNVVFWDVFERRFLATPVDRELESLNAKFAEIVAGLGLDDSYEPIDPSLLPEEIQYVIDALNLQELLREELRRDADLDIPVVRFILRRLAQLGDASVVDDVLDEVEATHPVFPYVVRYLDEIGPVLEAKRAQVGERLLKLYDDSILSELEYHRMWCLEPFAKSAEWGQCDRFYRLLADARDQASRRQLILAMGRAGQNHWFQSQWRSLDEYQAWPKRALIAGASCMPADGRKHWYRSIEPQLDPLEKAIVRWVRVNPFA